MKKFVAIILALAVLLSLSACATQEAVSYSAAWGRTDVYEKSVYKVTVEKAETTTFAEAPRLSGSGTYVSVISGDNDKGYMVETNFTFVGEYLMADGSKTPVNDKIDTKVQFNNAGNTFKPTSSYRMYDGSTIAVKDGKYTVEPLKYSSLVTYGEKKISVSTSRADGAAIEDLPSDYEIKYPKGVYFDNEQLLYVLRGMISDNTLTNGLYSAFALISGLSEDAVNMTANITKNTKTTLETYINGESANTDCYQLILAKSGNNNGKSIYLYYAQNDMGLVNSGENQIKVNRSRLIKYVQTIAYSNDNLIYDLVEYSYGE